MHRTILPFILLLLICAATNLCAQPSSWRYPYGNPEATRRNSTMTASQKAGNLSIKWRITSIRNSPVILSGGILSASGELRQQIVGMMNDTLVIVSERGIQLRKIIYGDSAVAFFPQPFTMTLCGLFDTTASSFSATTRPNTIGIGVERTTSAQPLWCFLADGTGRAVRSMQTGAAPSAAVYPVGSIVTNVVNDTSGKVFALVSQNALTSSPGSGKVTNGLREYRLTGKFHPFNPLDSAWGFDVAPKTYPQPPALLSVQRSGRFENYISLSTASYSFKPIVSMQLPQLGIPTESDKTYSVNTILNPDLRISEARRTKDTGLSFLGETHSYYIKLKAPSGDSSINFRLITENHDAARPGTALMVLARAEIAQAGNDGVFYDSAMKNLGWSIVAADLDGTAPGSVQRPSNPNNPGDEIIGAYRSLDGSDVENNKLYVFRYNTLGGTLPIPFTMFLDKPQPFKGRLLAAGDLVADIEGRQEIVTSSGNTITVRQMVSYDSSDFYQGRPFRDIASFTFDSPVVSVAIADVDGDGENDLLVCTRNSLYAVGINQPQPFGTVKADASVYCAGRKNIQLQWLRSIGGGERGVSIVLRNVTSGDSVVLADNYTTPNAFTAATASLKTGTYRIIIRDMEIAGIADSSTTFSVIEPTIGALGIPETDFHPGDLVHDSVALACISSPQLQRSFDGNTWETITGSSLSVTGDTAHINLSLPCPPSYACGKNPSITMYVRLTDADDPRLIRYDTVHISVPMRTIGISPDTGTSRTRSVAWSPSDFSCSSLNFSLSFDGGNNWQSIGTASTASGSFTFNIPAQTVGKASLRVCCDDTALCQSTRRDDFFRVELSESNVVVPNPFNPNKPVNVFCSDGAAIIYNPNTNGAVTLTIYDASRTIVRQIRDDSPHQPGGTYIACWDGKNSRGEIVANGTYICVVQPESSARIVLPIVVTKQ